MYHQFASNGDKPYIKHSLSPRIVLEAIDEIRGRETGYYEDNEAEMLKWGGNEFEEIQNVKMPRHEHVYDEFPSKR